MSKQKDVQYITGDLYIAMLAQGKISTERPKTAQEIEAERLINQCVAALERGEKIS